MPEPSANSCLACKELQCRKSTKETSVSLSVDDANRWQQVSHTWAVKMKTEISKEVWRQKSLHSSLQTPSVALCAPSTFNFNQTIMTYICIWRLYLCHPLCKQKHLVKDHLLTLAHLVGTAYLQHSCVLLLFQNQPQDSPIHQGFLNHLFSPTSVSIWVSPIHRFVCSCIFVCVLSVLL